MYLLTLENGPCGICHKLAIEDEECSFYYDCEGLNYEGGYAVDDNGNVIEYWNTDIVSEWQEEINEKEIDKIAKEYAVRKFIESDYLMDYNTENGIYIGFKEGYIKAKEK